MVSYKNMWIFFGQVHVAFSYDIYYKTEDTEVAINHKSAYELYKQSFNPLPFKQASSVIVCERSLSNEGRK